MSETCKFCGEQHEAKTAQVGPIPIVTCPNVPRDHLYMHDEPNGKPPGQLHRVVEPRGERPS